jgi:formylglycine-generating enzyme required for sulfatase activity
MIGSSFNAAARAAVVMAALLCASACAIESGSVHGVQRFSDCTSACPPMVVVREGAFLIGSPEQEAGRYSNEGPQRTLEIGAFAISETEITRGQYAVFVRETHRDAPLDCVKPGDGSSFEEPLNPSYGSWRDPGFPQTARHPVVCVSWEDANAYAQWLSEKTHETYRLPSEAEWEFAARGGTTSSFFWGASADEACAFANGSDPSLVRALPAWIETVRRAQREGDTRAGILSCDDGSAFTAPAGRYRPNGFGLYDMSGNVWEHVADCFVGGGYESLAPDGRARDLTDCRQRRVRGGSWDDYAIDLRVARRTGALSPRQRRNDTGFRVVREMRGTG